MSGFYEQMRGIADQLLGPSSQFAQGALRIKRMTPGSGPPHNPGPPSEAMFPLSGAVSGVADHVTDSLIQSTDKVLRVAVPEIEPALTDKVLIDGKEHQIVKIERKPEAGVAVAFVIYARR